MNRRGQFVCLAVLVGLCSSVGALTGSGDSATGPLETVAPVFSGLAVEPAQAAAGDTVTITFSVSESLAEEPVVTVGGNEADFVGEEKAGDYTYAYGVQETDVFGMASVEVSGSDALGNPGSLSSALVLEILEVPPVPVYGWLVFVALLTAGIVAVARRGWARGLLLVLVLLAAPMAVAEAPSVTNAAFVQQPDGAGGTEVVITYDLDAPNGPCDITVSLSKDGGVDGFPFAVTSVSGDLSGVSTGTGKQVVWDIRADYPEEDIPNARIRVTAEDGEPAPGETEIIMLPGDVPLELVWVPSGSYQMGRYPGEGDSSSYEDPQHMVTLAYGFWMGKYEVTQEQWLAVRGSWPGTAPLSPYGLGDTYPAYYISWDDTKDFITTLNAHIVSSGQGPLTVRLPSEAEWEYACRAGTQTRFYWGDDSGYTQIGAYAWYAGNNSPNGSKPVGEKTGNVFGLYDMSGNVLEWCEDDYHASYTDAPADGSPWIESPRTPYRMRRGGGWNSEASYCRSAYRDFGFPYSRHEYFGFRLAAVQ